MDDAKEGSDERSQLLMYEITFQKIIKMYIRILFLSML